MQDVMHLARLEKVWTRVPHLQACEPRKLSHVSGYAPTRFGLGKIGCAPEGPHRPPNIAQEQLTVRHDIVVCCWAAMSCSIPLFL